jgi:hypothetical protein
MKKLLALALLATSVSSFAASVKVTSFTFIRTSPEYSGPLAELCGRVEGAETTPSFVKVRVDPASNNPATYNTFAGKDGKFCLTVVTYRGRADVSLEGENGSTEASVR